MTEPISKTKTPSGKGASRGSRKPIAKAGTEKCGRGAAIGSAPAQAQPKPTSTTAGQDQPNTERPSRQMIQLSTLIPNPQNPRTISESAFAKLVNSVKAFPRMMELRPIVIGFDNTILGGNMRYRAITEGLGMTECPASWVVKAEDLTPEQVKRFIISDNAPEGASGEWDFDSLANQFDMADLKEWGFDEAELLGMTIPSENKPIDENAMGQTENECPKCGFKW